jgi:ribonuclease T1
MIRKWLRNGVLALACSASGAGYLIPHAFARNATPSVTSGFDSSRTASRAESASTAVISVSVLPGTARGTLALIQAGGPFPYAKDGAVFGNFERLLRPRPRGYYHEYTVQKARAYGRGSRGARRIVCGGPVRSTDECYYSNDHYASFKLIVG